MRGIPIEVYDVLKAYYSFIQDSIQRHPACLHHIRDIYQNKFVNMQENSGRNDFECFISQILHHYCGTIIGNLRGTRHLCEFNRYIQTQDEYPHNFQILDSRADIYPLEGAFNEINDHLEAAGHNLAIIVYQIENSMHTIVVGKDNDGVFYRDPNQYCVNVDPDNGFVFNLQSKIYEYILFTLN